MRIYVAGPITNGYEIRDPLEVQLNIISAVNVGIELVKKGHDPFVPHMNEWFTRTLTNRGEEDFSWEEYMRIDTAYLRCCEALFYVAPSKGADVELEIAKRLGIQTFYGLEQVPINVDKVDPVEAFNFFNAEAEKLSGVDEQDVVPVPAL